MALIEQFGSEDQCREYLETLRWPNGPVCMVCGSMSITDLPNRNLFQCSDCRNQFSVTSGTIMHDTHLPLVKWFMAIYLIVEGKKGISARQLGRTINVAYKTAWHLSHRIREALKTPDALLSGIIEVDETFIGGKTRGRGQGYKGNKTVVLGAIERGGEGRMKVAENRTAKEIRDFFDENISDDAEAIYTDEWIAYKNIAGDENTRHETVNHSEDEWVRGDVTTNTIEGMWSLFKRGVTGSFHKVSRKHLERYLDEFEFRFNYRNNPFIFRDALRELVQADRLTFQDLTR
ncbi:MAG: IS1595 family transposase [Chloroflexi bacterium]|nr:IS1595 family transposase [Chloroflexota bacterium]